MTKPSFELTDEELLECRKRAARKVRYPANKHKILLGRRDNSETMKRERRALLTEKIERYLNQEKTA